MSEKPLKKLEKTTLWANTLHLFHKYNEFTGPFYEAGYRDIICQVEARRDRMSFVSIDILATNEEKKHCCGIELTTDDSKDKDQQLDKYINLSPEEIGDQFGKTSIDQMDAILSTNHKNVTEYPHIICTDIYSVRNENSIKDKNLRNSLKKIKGVKISAPQTKFTIPPEASDYEIRHGLVSVIQQMIILNEAYSDEDLVRIGLDYLYRYLDYDHIVLLKRKITDAMEKLISLLPEDLGKKDGKYYNLNPNDQIHPKKLEKINNKLEIWVKNSNVEQSKLDSF